HDVLGDRLGTLFAGGPPVPTLPRKGTCISRCEHESRAEGGFLFTSSQAGCVTATGAGKRLPVRAAAGTPSCGLRARTLPRPGPSTLNHVPGDYGEVGYGEK